MLVINPECLLPFSMINTPAERNLEYSKKIATMNPNANQDGVSAELPREAVGERPTISVDTLAQNPTQAAEQLNAAQIPTSIFTNSNYWPLFSPTTPSPELLTMMNAGANQGNVTNHTD
jgi:hypothetical protein